MMEWMILLLLLFIFLWMGIIIRKRNNQKVRQGIIGEAKVKKELRKLPKEYKVFHDVYLPYEHGTSQIDHLVLSPYGIFVIETKNMHGVIDGNGVYEYWEQHYHSKVHAFYNPIKQNQGHIYTVANLLQIPTSLCSNMIVFVDDVQLDVVASTPILHLHQVVPYIKSYHEKRISTEKMQMYVDCMMHYNHHSHQVMNQHRKECQNHPLYCPKCNHELQRKKTKQGIFYGCSQYQKCHFTMKVEEKR